MKFTIHMLCVYIAISYLFLLQAEASGIFILIVHMNESVFQLFCYLKQAIFDSR